MVFIQKAAKADFNPNAKPLEIPTTLGSFDNLQEQLADIVTKLQKVPFDSTGENLDHTLAELDQTLKQVTGEVLPEFTQT